MSHSSHSRPPHLRARGTRHRARATQSATTHHATLVDSAWECEGLRRMTFQSASVDAGWELGDRVMMHVGSGTHRQYTVCGLHRARGVFEMLAVGHGGGPGGRWVRTAELGETISLFGPKPDLDVRTAGARNLIFLGDETTLGLYEAVHRVRQRSVRIWGALEHSETIKLSDCDLAVLSKVERISRDEALPGAGLNRWIREHDMHEPQTVFFVNGHGAAVRSLRLALLSMGVRGVAIRSRAFWGRK